MILLIQLGRKTDLLSDSFCISYQSGKSINLLPCSSDTLILHYGKEDTLQHLVLLYYHLLRQGDDVYVKYIWPMMYKIVLQNECYSFLYDDPIHHTQSCSNKLVYDNAEI